ncbi:MAG: rod shape-determining protein RodA [Lachnospiraceae bacterium]|nr:rod shape-determining protein RodA [Lachnospiraceae bacterium]MBQ4068973.1 rod shape-determining protein RodA [Lachnospiraceae bacterium]
MSSIINTLKNYKYRHLDIRLIILVFGLTILGIQVISSATAGELQGKQTLGMILGCIAMAIATFIDYHFILKFSWIIYLLNLVFLLAVKYAGDVHMGAQRWIDIGPIQLQPSELTKIFLIIFFANYIEKRKEKLNTILVLGGAVVLFLIPAYLVLKQPDLSTTIILGTIFCSIAYVGGVSYKIIGAVFGAGVTVAIVLVYLILQPNQQILQPYQYNRIVGFYDEDNEVAARINYQQENAVMAIGSGGLWGKGLNNNTLTSVKNGNYISEPQTDFIFCIVGEELGFVGAAGVIIALALIVFECFYIGIHAPDLSGRIICVGFGSWIAFQSFVNIAVVTHMIPNTGLTLPFVSYGLSSLISLFGGAGVILNISLQHKKNVLGGF